MYSIKPRPFLTVCVHKQEDNRGSTFAYPGFESGDWRYRDFAEYIIEWIPEFALRYGDYSNLNGATGIGLIRKAARSIYTTKRQYNRGEFGEILLHALIREYFHSQPAISKIFYKTSSNDTVKGFDAVHIVDTDDGDYEIWLGEVKFYKSIGPAIKHVTKELQQHLADGFLRNEFMFIEGKIDPTWPKASAMQELISDRVSLDDIRKRICLPVMLTYNSSTYKTHKAETQQFRDEITKQFEEIFEKFKISTSKISIKIHLFLVPMKCKDELVKVADEKLKALQG